MSQHGRKNEATPAMRSAKQKTAIPAAFADLLLVLVQMGSERLAGATRLLSHAEFAKHLALSNFLKSYTHIQKLLQRALTLTLSSHHSYEDA